MNGVSKLVYWVGPTIAGPDTIAKRAAQRVHACVRPRGLKCQEADSPEAAWHPGLCWHVPELQLEPTTLQKVPTSSINADGQTTPAYAYLHCFSFRILSISCSSLQPLPLPLGGVPCLAVVAKRMAHSRVLAPFGPATSSALHHRVPEGPQAELRAVVCQRSQAGGTSTSRSHHGQRGLICLPRHLASSSAAGSLSSVSLAQSSLTTCSAVSSQTPALVPLREVSAREDLKPLPRAVENIADDPALHNPLARQSRLSPGWMGVSALYVTHVLVLSTAAMTFCFEACPALWHDCLLAAD